MVGRLKLFSIETMCLFCLVWGGGGGGGGSLTGFIVDTFAGDFNILGVIFTKSCSMPFVFAFIDY